MLKRTKWKSKKSYIQTQKGIELKKNKQYYYFRSRNSPLVLTLFGHMTNIGIVQSWFLFRNETLAAMCRGYFIFVILLFISNLISYWEDCNIEILFWKYIIPLFSKEKYTLDTMEGFNARKVISEVYASFVLQCAVTGR